MAFIFFRSSLCLCVSVANFRNPLRFNPFDLRADRAQFLFYFLVPAIDVIDAVDQGLAFSRESGQDQRGRGAKVGGDQLRAGQTGRAVNVYAAAVDSHVRAQAHQFGGVHEAVLEDRLGDHRIAFGLRHERHVLRLHVGRESGVDGRGHVRGLVERARFAVAGDAQLIPAGLFDLNSNLAQLFDHRLQMTRLAICDHQLAAGNRGGDYESAGFDSVGNDRVVGAAESLNAGDGDRRRTGAFDFRAHFGEQLGEVYYLRLAGGVRDSRHAVGQCGGHHHVLSAGDGDSFKLDVGATQPRGAGFDHAAAQLDLRAHFFQRHQVQVYGALAYGAAPRQADARLTEPP